MGSIGPNSRFQRNCNERNPDYDPRVNCPYTVGKPFRVDRVDQFKADRIPLAPGLSKAPPKSYCGPTGSVPGLPGYREVIVRAASKARVLIASPAPNHIVSSRFPSPACIVKVNIFCHPVVCSPQMPAARNASTLHLSVFNLFRSSVVRPRAAESVHGGAVHTTIHD